MITGTILYKEMTSKKTRSKNLRKRKRCRRLSILYKYCRNVEQDNSFHYLYFLQFLRDQLDDPGQDILYNCFTEIPDEGNRDVVQNNSNASDSFFSVEPSCFSSKIGSRENLFLYCRNVEKDESFNNLYFLQILNGELDDYEADQDKNFLATQDQIKTNIETKNNVNNSKILKTYNFDNNVSKCKAINHSQHSNLLTFDEVKCAMDIHFLKTYLKINNNVNNEKSLLGDNMSLQKSGPANANAKEINIKRTITTDTNFTPDITILNNSNLTLLNMENELSLGHIKYTVMCYVFLKLIFSFAEWFADNYSLIYLICLLYFFHLCQ